MAAANKNTEPYWYIVEAISNDMAGTKQNIFAIFCSPLSGLTCSLLTAVNRETDIFFTHKVFQWFSFPIRPSNQSGFGAYKHYNVSDTKCNPIAFYWVNVKFCADRIAYQHNIYKTFKTLLYCFPGHFAMNEHKWNVWYNIIHNLFLYDSRVGCAHNITNMNMNKSWGEFLSCSHYVPSTKTSALIFLIFRRASHFRIIRAK